MSVKEPKLENIEVIAAILTVAEWQNKKPSPVASVTATFFRLRGELLEHEHDRRKATPGVAGLSV